MLNWNCFRVRTGKRPQFSFQVVKLRADSSGETHLDGESLSRDHRRRQRAIISVTPSRSARKPSCLEIENLSSSVHLVNTTAKQVAFRVVDWTRTTATKYTKVNSCFSLLNMQICTLSPWLHKLPKVKSLKFSYFDVR